MLCAIQQKLKSRSKSKRRKGMREGGKDVAEVNFVAQARSTLTVEVLSGKPSLLIFLPKS